MDKQIKNQTKICKFCKTEIPTDAQTAEKSRQACSEKQQKFYCCSVLQHFF